GDITRRHAQIVGPHRSRERLTGFVCVVDPAGDSAAEEPDDDRPVELSLETRRHVTATTRASWRSARARAWRTRRRWPHRQSATSRRSILARRSRGARTSRPRADAAAPLPDDRAPPGGLSAALPRRLPRDTPPSGPACRGRAPPEVASARRVPS